MFDITQLMKTSASNVLCEHITETDYSQLMAHQPLHKKISRTDVLINLISINTITIF